MKVFEERLGEEGLVHIKEEDLIASAEILGISAIKYYELKQNHTQDYIFSFDKILDPRGNTGVYLIY